jgi:ABC-type sugar transport system ATPase subunit
MGRAMIRKPEVFLYDEPLSNLDLELRVRLRLEIARMQRTLKATAVYVTHDQTEAMTLADQIVVLRKGRIEQVGSPLALYRSPANLFVAGFIGTPRINLFRWTRARRARTAPRFAPRGSPSAFRGRSQRRCAASASARNMRGSVRRAPARSASR